MHDRQFKEKTQVMDYFLEKVIKPLLIILGLSKICELWTIIAAEREPDAAI